MQASEFTSERSGIIIRKGVHVKFVHDTKNESFSETKILFYVNEKGGLNLNCLNDCKSHRKESSP